MNLKNLETFLTLSKIKNFTKTAETLNYAQSNVTMQIKQLEEELQVKLFERLGKSVVLTEEGNQLIPYAKRYLSLSLEIHDLYATHKKQKIVIGASESLSIAKLPYILSQYKKSHPEVELSLQLIDANEIAPMLLDNIVDIVLALDTPILNPALSTCFEHWEPVHLYASPEYAIVKKDNVTINDLNELPMILTKPLCCYRKQLEQDLIKSNVQPKIILETSSVQVIKETTLHGLGVCLLPQFLVEKELNNHQLYELAFPTDYHISAQLIHHKNKWISPILSDFMNTVKEYYI